MKKTLALVLAFALVFSTMTVAFAEDVAAIGADAKVCSDLGMLKGATGTVDAAYLATVPNRLQAAVMFLRLKGLEAEANAFAGTENFADANKVNWGKPVMAYLKAHPELGWVGDGTNFDPASAMTAQQYYKVMLEALGYKQNTATVVGDFTWENVMTFAATKGLVKNAAVTNFTVNDLAAATVEALKANVKDTTKSLVATLVEAGKIDKTAATTAGVLVETATSTAALSAVIASANDKVEVTFDADVAKDFAENVANYKVVVKGSTTALEVKAAKAVGTTMVELTTAAQTGGTGYTLTVGAVSMNFAGLAKGTATPEIDTVKCIDTNTIEVVFKGAVDRTSAEDIANYTLNNGATVAKAELWIDQDDSRKTVKLTTEGVANNKVYKLNVANVKSADMVAIKTVEKSVTGITDTKAPKFKGNVVVKNNQRILVVFDDAHGVDAATVQNIANWSIDGLKINSIVAKDYVTDGSTTYGLADDYSYNDVVEINTDPMTASHKYTITASNLIDGSSAKNAISKVLTDTFYGVAVDKTGPKPGSIDVLGDNLVEIPFNDNNRLDYATATDVNNYTFSDGLQVLSAKILRSSKPDTAYGKTVVLTTSTMDTDTTYKLSMANVADEFGNVMTAINNRNIKRSSGQDIAPPAVKTVSWLDKNTVDVYFNEKLDIDSANDPTNYVLNGGIGAVRKAEISGGAGYMMVELTTPEMTTNTNYTLTVNGVKDRVGNEMSSYKAYFTAGQTSVDVDAPVIDNVVAINRHEIQVTFNEAVKADAAATLTLRTVDANGNIGTSDFTVAGPQGIAVPNYTVDDNTTVVFYVNPQTLSESQEYVVYGMTKVTDTHNNSYKVPTDTSDRETFYGNSDIQDALEVVGVDQVDMKTLQVTFSRPVVFGTANKGHVDPVSGDVDDNTKTIGSWTATIDTDDDETTDALSVVTFESTTGKITPDHQLTLNLSSITDYSGTGVASADTSYEYTPYLDDTDKPVIDYVESLNTAKVQVHFNESMDTAGSYSIKGIMHGATTESTINVNGAVDADDDTLVNIAVSTLEPGNVYTLTPKTSAKDIAGNTSDIKDVTFEFVASAVQVLNYIKGVAVVDGRNIEVRATAGLTNVKIFNDTLDITDVVTYSSSAKTAYVALYQPLKEDVEYTVTAKIAGNDVDYTFTGILAAGGLDVSTSNIITFSDWNKDDYVVNVVYGAVTTNIAAPADNTTGFDATTALGTVAAGADYMVEVYRVVNGVTEDAPVYSAVFTK